YRLAHNLVRGLLLEAAFAHGLAPWRLGFKGVCQAVRQWAPVLAAACRTAPAYREAYGRLLEALARNPLPERPDRSEPRVRKRRPKNYTLQTQPRHCYKDTESTRHPQ